MKKKTILVLMAAAIAASMMIGCGPKKEAAAGDPIPASEAFADDTQELETFSEEDAQDTIQLEPVMEETAETAETR